jgi:hypothetical protein
MSLEESFSRLEAEIDVLIAKSRSVGDGFQKGLTQGLLFALLLLRDRATQPEAPTPAEERPRRAAKGSKPKLPPKDQLELFKP